MTDGVVLHGFRFGMDDYLSPGYAADLTGVSTGRLKAIPIPSTRNHRNDRQYKVADVLAWMEKRDRAAAQRERDLP